MLPLQYCMKNKRPDYICIAKAFVLFWSLVYVNIATNKNLYSNEFFLGFIACNSKGPSIPPTFHFCKINKRFTMSMGFHHPGRQPLSAYEANYNIYLVWSSFGL